jgi:hypothetical protein
MPSDADSRLTRHELHRVHDWEALNEDWDRAHRVRRKTEPTSSTLHASTVELAQTANVSTVANDDHLGE